MLNAFFWNESIVYYSEINIGIVMEYQGSLIVPLETLAQSDFTSKLFAAIDELRKIMSTGVTPEDMEKIKEQQKRKLEVEMKQNQFWMGSLYEAYYLGNNPGDILNRQKQTESITSKMIQDAAKKYINLNHYIRAMLQPDKNAEKTKKPF